MCPIEEKKLLICHQCVEDEYLKKRIQIKGKRNKCSYCQRKFKTVALEYISDIIGTAIQEHFYHVSNDSNSFWEPKGDDVNEIIQWVGGIEPEIADDVQEYLSDNFCGHPKEWEEDPYGSEAFYMTKPPDSDPLQESWDHFCYEIKHEARFFSQAAEKELRNFFGDVESLRTLDNNPIIRCAGPDTDYSDIFRARVSLSNKTLEHILKYPVQELSAPPPKYAQNGRMNAIGVSVFYGATDAETCVAEVRPPIGSHVVIGKFKITHAICLLDLDLLRQVYSKCGYCNPESGERFARCYFLRCLVDELTRPVMPGEETFEYLPTQVVAEYLAEKVSPQLDGIIWKSSQTQSEGKNITLFQKSCGVEPYTVPEGTKFFISHGCGPPDDYDDSIDVHEESPENPQETESQTNIDTEASDDCSRNKNTNLCLDVNNGIEVRDIKGVNYHSRKRSVTRVISSDGGTDSSPF